MLRAIPHPRTATAARPRVTAAPGLSGSTPPGSPGCRRPREGRCLTAGPPRLAWRLELHPARTRIRSDQQRSRPVLPAWSRPGRALQSSIDRPAGPPVTNADFHAADSPLATAWWSGDIRCVRRGQSAYVAAGCRFYCPDLHACLSLAGGYRLAVIPLIGVYFSGRSRSASGGPAGLIQVRGEHKAVGGADGLGQAHGPGARL